MELRLESIVDGRVTVEGPAPGPRQAWLETLNASRSQCSGVHLVSSGCEFLLLQTPPHAFEITRSVSASLSPWPSVTAFVDNHDASLHVEHLPPPALTIILQGGGYYTHFKDGETEPQSQVTQRS